MPRITHKDFDASGLTLSEEHESEHAVTMSERVGEGGESAQP